MTEIVVIIYSVVFGIAFFVFCNEEINVKIL